jgi:hypothetical protein
MVVLSKRVIVIDRKVVAWWMPPGCWKRLHAAQRKAAAHGITDTPPAREARACPECRTLLTFIVTAPFRFFGKVRDKQLHDLYWCGNADCAASQEGSGAAFFQPCEQHPKDRKLGSLVIVRVGMDVLHDDGEGTPSVTRLGGVALDPFGDEDGRTPAESVLLNVMQPAALAILEGDDFPALCGRFCLYVYENECGELAYRPLCY